MRGEENQLVKEKNENLQAEMLEIVGVKKETPADIFLREFQAYQKESVAPVYNREFIAFQKESKENIESSPTSLKDAQKENSTKSSEDSSSLTKNIKSSSSHGLKTPDIDSQVASFLAVCTILNHFVKFALRCFMFILNHNEIYIYIILFFFYFLKSFLCSLLLVL